jgi:hypothetical protein
MPYPPESQMPIDEATGETIPATDKPGHEQNISGDNDRTPDDELDELLSKLRDSNSTVGGRSVPRTQSPVAPVADNAVLMANVGDQPSAEDTLGFKPYVEAIASFLTNEVTKPPLTLSIEGEWGSGKSSFMLQLEAELRKKGARIIRFNAWRHDKDDAMWAAFAIEFIRKLSDQLPPRERWAAHAKLFLQRFQWRTGWLDIARLVAMSTLLLAILLVPFFVPYGKIAERLDPPAVDGQPAADWKRDALKTTIGAGGAAGYVAMVIFLLIKLKDFTGNPLSVDLKQHLDAPAYQSRVAFIERFHEDFARMIDAYAGKQKVYVFIDDLDRCEVPKAADLMQALNLMISDSNQLIFIMGMDREKVAAGLAVKYEKLLPYLAPAPNVNGVRTTATFDPVLGLEYGYSFIEKFIQLPFLVPQASEAQVNYFLKHIFGRKTGAPAASAPPLSSPLTAAGKQAEENVTENSDMVSDILRMVAPAFDYNPRRLKQFINAFRLKTFIASRTGLFDPPVDDSKYDQLTPQQLGKFVAISLRWPLLLADLDNERDLLSELQRRVLRGDTIKLIESQHQDGRDGISDALLRWYRRASLRQLLLAQLIKEDGAPVAPEIARNYSLEKLDVSKLLQVSPPTRPAAATSPAEARDAS